MFEILNITQNKDLFTIEWKATYSRDAKSPTRSKTGTVYINRDPDIEEDQKDPKTQLGWLDIALDKPLIMEALRKPNVKS